MRAANFARATDQTAPASATDLEDFAFDGQAFSTAELSRCQLTVHAATEKVLVIVEVRVCISPVGTLYKVACVQELHALVAWKVAVGNEKRVAYLKAIELVKKWHFPIVVIWTRLRSGMDLAKGFN